MATGTCKWFNDKKGFGFIAPHGGGEDLFVHFSNIVSSDRRRSLKEGQEVEFETQKGRKGMEAINVREASRTRRG